MTAEIRVLSGARTGLVIRLTGPVLVGRAADAGLRFDPERERQVSSRHAVIGSDENGGWVRDEGSRNGTFVNGRRVTEARLRHGDRLRFGGEGPEIEFLEVRPVGETAAVATETGPAVARSASLESQNLRLRRAVLLLTLLLLGSTLLWMWAANRRRAGWAGERALLLARIDSVLAAGDSAVRERAGETEELAVALRESRSEVARVGRALENAAGTDSTGIQSLRRELQSAMARLARQQLAASFDYAAVERRVRRGVAVVWVENGDGDVVTGTAFAIRPDATLITARHILQDAGGAIRPRRIAVQFSDSDQVWRARLIASSADADIAILKVDDIAGDVVSLPPFNERPDTLGPGTPVAWIGFPLGGETWPQDERTGRIARPLGSVGVITAVRNDAIEVQGYGAAGASGSPILDRDGRIVGILYGGRRESSGQVVFVVPAAGAARLLESQR